MPATKPIYLRICISICYVLSNMVAGIHYFLFKTGLLKVSLVITDAPDGVYKNLLRIWYVRFFRRIVSVLVRTSLRRHVLQLINIKPTDGTAPGSVMVSCHTPWARLIVQWCVEKNYAMIVGWGPWTKRASIARHATGFNELRNLVNHLRSGGRVIIMADIFNNLKDCPVRFLEKNCNASLFPFRLAKISNTPLVSVMPVLENETIGINIGPQVCFSNADSEPGKVMQLILAYFEKEIKQNPSNWLGYIRGSLSK